MGQDSGTVRSIGTLSSSCGGIIPKEIPPCIPPYHAKNNPNASCAYHARHIGHSTKDCWPLKDKIQELINQKILSFSEETPNIKANPLPNHNGPVVNAFIEEEIAKSIRGVDDVKTPMSVVVEKLKEHGFLEGVHDNCVVCDSCPDCCDVLKVVLRN